MRSGRSLVNTFPFNSADTALPSRANRQGGNDVAVDFASVAAAGKRCIDKVEEVEETEYDEEVNTFPPSLQKQPLCVSGAVRPFLRPSMPHLLHDDLLRAAGGGVRRELQEELLHRVLQDRRPSRGPDLRRAPRQGLRRPRAGGVQVLNNCLEGEVKIPGNKFALEPHQLAILPRES